MKFVYKKSKQLHTLIAELTKVADIGRG